MPAKWAASVLRHENCVQFFGGEGAQIIMGAQARDGFDAAAMAALIAGSGVRASAAEVETAARALAGIAQAEAALLQTVSFDETIEDYFRLLENDAGEAGR